MVYTCSPSWTSLPPPSPSHPFMRVGGLGWVCFSGRIHTRYNTYPGSLHTRLLECGWWLAGDWEADGEKSEHFPICDPHFMPLETFLGWLGLNWDPSSYIWDYSSLLAGRRERPTVMDTQHREKFRNNFKYGVSFKIQLKNKFLNGVSFNIIFLNLPPQLRF